MPFRKDFIWGAATASYQIEGAYDEDGKGRSIWDDFSNTPGKTFEGHTGNVACDHYHRFREDVELLSRLGIKSYRFSVSWPRVLPEGVGTPNEAGLRFYDELINALLEKGIRPYMTIFHWDYPSALQARGGWANPDSPLWFEEYASLIARRYGDRVKDFFTFNEPEVFIGLGYTIGVMAPGMRLSPVNSIPMSFNVHRAHGLAVKALRSLVPDARVGFVGCGRVAMPASDSAEDIEAARAAFFATPEDDGLWAWSNAWWDDPIILGSYPEDGLKAYGKFLPKGYERALDYIKQPLDYYGQNIYEGFRVRSDGKGGFTELPMPVGLAKTACDWPVTPDALYWGAKHLYGRYKLPILITENGMSAHDAVSLDGKVHDPNRVDYMHRYLLGLRRAAEEGVDVRGYFAWSLMDNYEWARGYGERFGLIYVDFETQKRIPKDSAHWYSEVAANNGESL